MFCFGFFCIHLNLHTVWRASICVGSDGKGSVKVSSCHFHLWCVPFSLTFLNFGWFELATPLRSATVVVLSSELFSLILPPRLCLCLGFCVGERRVIQIGNSVSSISASFTLVYFFQRLNPVEFKLFWWVFSPVFLVVDFYHLIIFSLFCWGQNISPVTSIKTTRMYEVSVVPRLCFKNPKQLTESFKLFFPYKIIRW